MKKVGNWVAASWMGGLYWLFGLAAVGTLLWYRLGSLVPGVSSHELTVASSTDSIEKIINNPIGLPHKSLQYISQQISVSPGSIRVASTLLGLFVIACFYYVLRNWYTRRVAILGTLVFATSPWLLHIARIGLDNSIYMLLFGAVACTIWLQNTKGNFWSIATAVLLIVALLYTPGMIWFVVPALLWQFGRLGAFLEGQSKGLLTIVGFGVLLVLAPIGWAMFQQPDLIKTYFGLPQGVPPTSEILRNLLEIPKQLFWQGPDNPEIWLGKLSLLGWFGTVMFIIGLYAYFSVRRLDRAAFIIFVFIFGTILISIGGPVDIALLMPFAFLLVAGGIALMLQQWFTIFPRNPFARGTGALLMFIVVLLAVYANMTHYFIAWPRAPETKQVFQQKI